jgi:hypothetical protein
MERESEESRIRLPRIRVLLHTARKSNGIHVLNIVISSVKPEYAGKDRYDGFCYCDETCVAS